MVVLNTEEKLLQSTLIKNLDDLNNVTTEYIRFICSCCKKERINKKDTFKDFKCGQCRGLDTLEKRTGYRGNLKNPILKQNLDIKTIEKLGVKRPFLLKSVQEKVNKTLMDESSYKRKPMGFIRKDVMQNKFGVDNIMELKEYREKIMNTLSQRHKNYYDVLIDEKFDFSKMNKLEKDFYENILQDNKKLYFSNRKLLKYYEIDFLDKDKNIGYEIGSEYWHTVKEKNKNYHINKYKQAEKSKVRLYQFFEEDYKKVNLVLKSYIQYKNINKLNIVNGDEAEFNYFNLSYKKESYNKFYKIIDNNNGHYIMAENNNFIQIFPTDHFGSLVSISEILLNDYNLFCDNRLSPSLKEGDILSFESRIYKNNIIEDAGYKIIKKGTL